jgi:tetratricopeptide (TPR) repeat protein
MRWLQLGLMVLWPLAATAAPVADEALPPPTMEERQAAFGMINEAMSSGRLAQAADLLVELSGDETQAVFRAEAFARLAVVLGRLELPYGSLLAYEKALRADPVAVGSEVSKALDLGEQIGDEAVLEPVFAENLGIAADEVARSRMAYLAARENHRRENYGLASAMLMMVKPIHPDYPDAQALQGVVKSMQGKYNEAIIPLQIALATGAKANRGSRFESTVHLNIARAYFAAENFVGAVEYYAKIPRKDPKWLVAQFERSWAHFRVQDMSGTLAQLHNHESPFFDDLYFPEGSLLRVYSLFLLCKFPDASKQIEAFQSRYRPQHSRLMEVAAMRERDLFDAVRASIDSGKTDLPASIMAHFSHEDRLADSLTAIRNAEDELARLRNVAVNPFAGLITQWVEARRAALIDAEGARISKRVRRMEQELNQMLADSDISKLDLLQMETRLYERASIIGELPEGKRRVKRRVRSKADQRMWPWQGEYWADEVGYYRIDTKPECPDGMQAGGGTGG